MEGSKIELKINPPLRPIGRKKRPKKPALATAAISMYFNDVRFEARGDATEVLAKFRSFLDELTTPRKIERQIEKH